MHTYTHMYTVSEGRGTCVATNDKVRCFSTRR